MLTKRAPVAAGRPQVSDRRRSRVARIEGCVERSCEIVEHRRDLRLDDLVVVSPDAGRVKLAKKFAEMLDMEWDLMLSVSEYGKIVHKYFTHKRGTPTHRRCCLIVADTDRNAETDPLVLDTIYAEPSVQEVPAVANKKIVEIPYAEFMDASPRVFDSAEKILDVLYPQA